MKPFTDLDGSLTAVAPDPYVSLLRKVMAEEAEWVKVHAAEYLLWAGHPEGVKEAFLQENKLYGDKPKYRIGIWRVLAQAAASEQERKKWTDLIMNAFLDNDGPDCLHASVTLAKLKISPMTKDRQLTEETLQGPVKPLALYTQWSVAFTAPDSLKAAPGKLLDVILKAGDPSEKGTPAYALRQLKGLTDKQWERLAAVALTEPVDSPARIYLLSTAFTTVNTGQKPESLPVIHTEILKYKNSVSKGEISEMCAALAERGTSEDLLFLKSLFGNLTQLTADADKADVQAAAAYAILRIEGR